MGWGGGIIWIADLIKSCMSKLLSFCRQLLLFCKMDYCDIIQFVPNFNMSHFLRAILILIYTYLRQGWPFYIHQCLYFVFLFLQEEGVGCGGVGIKWIADLIKSCMSKLLFCRQWLLFCEMDYCDIILVVPKLNMCHFDRVLMAILILIYTYLRQGWPLYIHRCLYFVFLYLQEWLNLSLIGNSK